MDNVTRLLMQGAAGAAGGDPTYVDDVFSTYLYKGDGQSGRAISNGIKLSNNNAGNGVTFDANGDYLTTSSSSDYSMGTGDYTVECWVKINTGKGNYGIFQGGGLNTSYLTGPTVFYYTGSGLSFGNGAEHGTNTHPSLNQWFHIALVKNGSNTTFYYNGTDVKTVSDTHNYTNQSFALGGYYSSSYLGPISISNFRVVKGTAVYTSSFTVPTESLTNVTNTKLLCCQGSSVTAATVITGTITANGNPNISSGPFTADDGEGGMVWIKGRTGGGYGHRLVDTVRGATKAIESYDSTAEATESNGLTSFNNNGFTLGSQGHYNGSGMEMSSWTFRKQKGFFDIVTYTGNNTAGRQIAHSLGSVPGMIMVKRLSGASNWAVYHRGTDATAPEDYWMTLNATYARQDQPHWNDTKPTSTHFTVGNDYEINGPSSQTYVAYVFAGGASDEPGAARSVACDASGDYLSLGSSSDLAMGTGDFTIEGWYKINAKQNFGFFMNGPSGLSSTYGITVWNYTSSSYGLQFFANGTYQATGFTPPDGQWFHLALVRNSGTTSLYYNGELLKAAADTTNYTNTTFQIGGYDSAPYLMNGSVSNFRIVKGTAVYTSSFKPPTQGLAAITNTVLLCCNKNTVTGSTVTPGTITSNGNPQSSTDTPFDDPAGFVFGEGKDQNLVKCGSYKGTGTGTGPEINLGFEPEFLIVKNVTSANSWFMFDSMRGITTGYNDFEFYANSSSDEVSVDRLSLTPTGFKLKDGEAGGLNTGDTHLYIAVRRPDGYVGKPAEVGTDAFAMSMGSSANNFTPSFISGWPVDTGIMRNPTGSSEWYTHSRLTGQRYVETNTTDAEASAGTNCIWDSMTGFFKNQGSNVQGWMWKRHAGMDVVCYIGKGGTLAAYAHSLGKIPEMIWVKRRDGGNPWSVYHKGLNGGSNPEGYGVQLNTSAAEAASSSRWGNTAPTSTHFFAGGNTGTNNADSTYIAMLFASVEGICKVGYYTGTGSTQTITTGFQPRFAIIKRVNTAQHWYVFDTTRGWTSGNDQYIKLDLTDAQAAADLGEPISTGFQVGSDPTVGANGDKYIYYAHA